MNDPAVLTSPKVDESCSLKVWVCGKLCNVTGFIEEGV